MRADLCAPYIGIRINKEKQANYIKFEYNIRMRVMLPKGIRRSVRSRRGRIPFALVAVFMLAGSFIITTTMGTLMSLQIEAKNSSSRATKLAQVSEDAFREIETRAYYIASSVVSSEPTQDFNMSRVNSRIKTEFANYINQKFSPYKDVSGNYEVKVLSHYISVFAEPMVSDDNVRLTKKVVLSGNYDSGLGKILDTYISGNVSNDERTVYLRVSGGAVLETVAKSSRSSPMKKNFYFDSPIPYPLPLLKNKMALFEQNAQSSLTDVGRTVRYILTTLAQYRALRGDGSGSGNVSNIISELDVELALNLALMLETASIYRTIDINSIKAFDDVFYRNSYNYNTLGQRLWNERERQVYDAYVSRRASIGNQQRFLLENIINQYMKNGTIDAADLYMYVQAYEGDDLSKIGATTNRLGINMTDQKSIIENLTDLFQNKDLKESAGDIPNMKYLHNINYSVPFTFWKGLESQSEKDGTLWKERIIVDQVPDFLVSGAQFSIKGAGEPKGTFTQKSSKVDLVFVVDSSVSMIDELRAVCDNIDVVKAALQSNGIDFEYKVYLLGAGSVYHITTNPDPQYRIENMCGVDLPQVIGLNDQLMGITYDGAYESEMWGAGVKWVAKYHPWREGAQRIVVPMSDECAWGGYNDGYGTAPNWPHTPNNDNRIITQAIQYCKTYNVTAYAFYGDFDDDWDYQWMRDGTEVKNEMRNLTYATGGNFYKLDSANSAQFADTIVQISLSGTNFTTSWEINISGKFELRTHIDESMHAQDGAHRTAWFNDTIDLDMNIPIVIYTTTKLNGVHYETIKDSLGIGPDLITDTKVIETFENPLTNWITKADVANGAKININQSTNRYAGSFGGCINYTITTTGFGLGCSVNYTQPVSIQNYNTLMFYMEGLSGQQLRINLIDNLGERWTYLLTKGKSAWEPISIPLTAFSTSCPQDFGATIDGILNSPIKQIEFKPIYPNTLKFYLDNVSFVYSKAWLVNITEFFQDSVWTELKPLGAWCFDGICKLASQLSSGAYEAWALETTNSAEYVFNALLWKAQFISDMMKNNDPAGLNTRIWNAFSKFYSLPMISKIEETSFALPMSGYNVCVRYAPIPKTLNVTIKFAEGEFTIFLIDDNNNARFKNILVYERWKVNKTLEINSRIDPLYRDASLVYAKGVLFNKYPFEITTPSHSGVKIGWAYDNSIPNFDALGSEDFPDAFTNPISAGYNAGIPVFLDGVNVSTISDDELSEYDLIIITAHNPITLPNEIKDKLQRYYNNGGVIWFDNCHGMQIYNFFAPFRFHDWWDGNTYNSVVVNSSHPVIGGSGAPYPLSQNDIRNLGDWYDHSTYLLEYDGYSTIIKESIKNSPLVAVLDSGLGNGKVLVTGQDILCGCADGDVEDYKFFGNVLYWARTNALAQASEKRVIDSYVVSLKLNGVKINNHQTDIRFEFTLSPEYPGINLSGETVKLAQILNKVQAKIDKNSEESISRVLKELFRNIYEELGNWDALKLGLLIRLYPNYHTGIATSVNFDITSLSTQRKVMQWLMKDSLYLLSELERSISPSAEIASMFAKSKGKYFEKEDFERIKFEFGAMVSDYPQIMRECIDSSMLSGLPIGIQVTTNGAYLEDYNLFFQNNNLWKMTITHGELGRTGTLVSIPYPNIVIMKDTHEGAKGVRMSVWKN